MAVASHAVMRVTKVTALPLLTLLTFACTSAGDDGDIGSDQAGLEVTVQLPQALGAQRAITARPGIETPTEIYPTELQFLEQDPGLTTQGLNILAEPAPVALAAQVDLSKWAVAPGNQGKYGSCASWSSGYTSMGWWLTRTGIAGAPLNPMFLYTLVKKGPVNQCGNNGSYLTDVLDLVKAKGVAPQADFPSKDCVVPGAAAMAAAARFKITGYSNVDLRKDAIGALKAALSTQKPVVLGVYVNNTFMNARSSSFYIDGPSQDSRGGHAIVAMGYDEKGVWIENSWGTVWGKGGWAQLSWNYLTGKQCGRQGACLMQAAIIQGIAAAPKFDPATAP
jgi:Papain family cysteine protease